MIILLIVIIIINNYYNVMATPRCAPGWYDSATVLTGERRALSTVTVTDSPLRRRRPRPVFRTKRCDFLILFRVGSAGTRTCVRARVCVCARVRCALLASGVGRERIVCCCLVNDAIASQTGPRRTPTSCMGALFLIRITFVNN